MNVVCHTIAALMILLFSPFEQTLTKTSAEDSTNSSDSEQEICLTQGCVIAAATLLNRINESIDPCDDFYEFACGTYIDKTFLPEGQSQISPLTELADKQKYNLRKLFEEKISEKNDSAIEILVKNLYNSCMNAEGINKKGLEPVLEIVNKYFGGWAVIEGSSWNEENFSWIEAMYTSRNIGLPINTMFDFGVYTNFANSTQRIIWIDSPSFFIPREYLTMGWNDSLVQSYLQLSSIIAVLMGANSSKAVEEMADALQFEIELANITLSQEDRRNVKNLINIKTIGELQILVPDIPWLNYINRMLPENLTVNETEKINIGDLGYITNFTKIRTTKRIIANYIVWRIFGDSMAFLSEDIRNLGFKLLKLLKGATSTPSRWEDCVGLVSQSLVFATDNLYIKNYFDEDSKKQVEQIVIDLKAAFNEILNNTDWMDLETKEQGLTKLEEMDAFVAFSEEIVNDAIVANFYSKLTIDVETIFLHNMYNISKFYLDYALSLLREKVNGSHWTERPPAHSINAYYSLSRNSLEFPAGILQGFVFQHNRPKYMNFGAIGCIIGHEITHGFDDQGRNFDEDGNIRDWWDDATEKSFLERAQCIIDQYSNFVEPQTGLNLNGVNTQGENIADNGGVKTAYKAYGRWVQRNGMEDKLPGLNYTQNQLFWISYAQFYCNKATKEIIEQSILLDVHSPVRFRVIGPLSNSKDFAEDFKCSSGSNMNPTSKCTVW